MPTALDLLNEPEFSDARLTDTINVPPAVTGRLAQIGLYRSVPISTTYAKIGVDDQQLSIIPSRERGGPSNLASGRGRQTALINIPHFPLGDAITPSDVQNIMAWGETQQMATLAGIMNDKMLSMRAKHDATHAFLDWGGLNGMILDADGYELLDTFDAFGLAQTTLDMALSSSTTDIAARTRAVKSASKLALKGMPATGMHMFASPEFFDAYISHPNVQEAYRYYAAANGQNPARDDITDGFYHAGMMIERVDETFDIRQDDDTFVTQPAIPAGEAIAVPLGTDVFRRYLAPPDTIFDANSAPDIGQLVYVATEERKFGKGIDIHSESNVLPICIRPSVMIKVTQS
jgi:hypothetical protein